MTDTVPDRECRTGRMSEPLGFKVRVEMSDQGRRSDSLVTGVIDDKHKILLETLTPTRQTVKCPLRPMETGPKGRLHSRLTPPYKFPDLSLQNSDRFTRLHRGKAPMTTRHSRKVRNTVGPTPTLHPSQSR